MGRFRVRGGRRCEARPVNRMPLNSVTGPILLLEIVIAAGAGAAIAAAIVAMWFDNILEAWEGASLLTACAVFVGLTIVMAGTPGFTFMLVILVVGAVAARVLSRAGDRALERRMLDDDERNARQAIQFDYKNAAAHSLLGDVLRKRGRLRDAIVEYEISLNLQPDQPQERRKLETAVQELALQEGIETICPQCKATWPREARTCPECGTPRSKSRRLARWMAAGGMETLVWAGVTLGAVSFLLWIVGLKVLALTAFGAAAWLGGVGILARGLFRLKPGD